MIGLEATARRRRRPARRLVADRRRHGRLSRGACRLARRLADMGSFLRRPVPGSAAGRRIDQGRTRRASRAKVRVDADTLDRVEWWNAVAPSYRWSQIAVEEILRAGLNSSVASRHLALLHTALADAMIAAWDSKRAYDRPRPTEMDPTLRRRCQRRIARPTRTRAPWPERWPPRCWAKIFPERAAEFARSCGGRGAGTTARGNSLSRRRRGRH